MSVPVCSKCETAYLVGEQHVCIPRQPVWVVVVYGAIGSVLGALLGYVSIDILCRPLHWFTGRGEHHCTVLMIFWPLFLAAGPIIGTVVGARFANIRARTAAEPRINLTRRE